MKEEKKTNDQPLEELKRLRRRVAELEQAETERVRVEEAVWESQQFLQSTPDTLSANISTLHVTIHDRRSQPCPCLRRARRGRQASYWHHHSCQVPEAAPDQVRGSDRKGGRLSHVHTALA